MNFWSGLLFALLRWPRNSPPPESVLSLLSHGRRRQRRGGDPLFRFRHAYRRLFSFIIHPPKKEEIPDAKAISSTETYSPMDRIFSSEIEYK